MPGPNITRTLGRTRALRKLSVVKLMALAEVLVLLREHMNKLEPEERRRLIELVKRGRARPSHLSTRERRELSALVSKAEPRQFMNRAVEKIAGVPLWTRERDRR